MLLFDGGLGLLLFALWLFCIIDVVTTRPEDCRTLPKLAWLLIVVLLSPIGAVAWLLAGHNWHPASPRFGARGGFGAAFTGRGATKAPTRARPLSPDDDEEFLAGLRARAEEQRRRAREAQQRDSDEPPGAPPPA